MSTPFPPPPEVGRSATPFWKRWWFWVIVVVVILIAAGIGSSETADEEAEGGSPSPVTSAMQPTASPVLENAPVPDVVGMKSVDVAMSELEAGGFNVSVETRLTNSAPKGTVLRQSEPPGSSVELGGTITLTVAQPLPKIPNVVGKTLANAKRALANAGFEVGEVTLQTSSKRKGTVISQSPHAGTSARPGRAVSLVTARPAPQPTSNCTPGYSPCLPPASDYDCAGGTGDGPEFTGPVRVTGSDPYGLDSDNDGFGCQ
jgi:resuscitation-promoting factor RpfB